MGSTTTATWRKFLAAARTIVGPPTSTFSTASSNVQPFDTLSSNG